MAMAESIRDIGGNTEESVSFKESPKTSVELEYNMNELTPEKLHFTRQDNT